MARDVFVEWAEVKDASCLLGHRSELTAWTIVGVKERRAHLEEETPAAMPTRAGCTQKQLMSAYKKSERAHPRARAGRKWKSEPAVKTAEASRPSLSSGLTSSESIIRSFPKPRHHQYDHPTCNRAHSAALAEPSSKRQCPDGGASE
jgi:hypothetical protein